MTVNKKSVLMTVIAAALCAAFMAGCSDKMPAMDTQSVSEETTAPAPTQESADAGITQETSAESVSQMEEPEEASSKDAPSGEALPGISAVAEYVTSGSEFTQRWSPISLEIAASIYQDFIPCAVRISDKWRKGLYNKENNLLVTQKDGRGDIYIIYHGDEEISIPVGSTFPDDIRVQIKLIDVNGDGADELHISAYRNGTASEIVSNASCLIGMEPFVLMTDIYGGAASPNEFVPDCRIVSAEAAEEGTAKVQAEFTLQDKRKYTLDMEIDDADLSCLDQYKIYLCKFSNSIYEEEEGEEGVWKVMQNFSFIAEERTDTGKGRTGGAYVKMCIELEYDAATGRYIQGDGVTIEYSPYQFYY